MNSLQYSIFNVIRSLRRQSGAQLVPKNFSNIFFQKWGNIRPAFFSSTQFLTHFLFRHCREKDALFVALKACFFYKIGNISTIWENEILKKMNENVINLTRKCEQTRQIAKIATIKSHMLDWDWRTKELIFVQKCFLTIELFWFHSVVRHTPDS